MISAYTFNWCMFLLNVSIGFINWIAGLPVSWWTVLAATTSAVVIIVEDIMRLRRK